MRPTEAYPLGWPVGKPRTPREDRKRARFGNDSLSRLVKMLKDEVRLLGGADVIVSSNLKLRRDGFPFSDQAQPQDTGVAVYFNDADSRAMCFACDRWDKAEHNLKAIVFTVNALRGIERWGGGRMVQAAFAGFAALPPVPTPNDPWHVVLNVPEQAPAADVLLSYKSLALKNHPDRGGSHKAMAKINAAFEAFKKARGLP